VRRYLDRCAASTDAQPVDCPFSYYDPTVTGVHWSITAYPTLSVSVEEGQIVVTSDEPGSAHLDAVSNDAYFGPTPVSDDESIYLSGTLDYSGDPDAAVFELSPGD
jgi:hypothetical protein